MVNVKPQRFPGRKSKSPIYGAIQQNHGIIDEHTSAMGKSNRPRGSIRRRKRKYTTKKPDIHRQTKLRQCQPKSNKTKVKSNKTTELPMLPKHLFCWHDWGASSTSSKMPPIPEATLEDTSNYTIINNRNPQTDVVVLDSEDQSFVVAKLSPAKSQQQGGVRQSYWNGIRRDMPIALTVKPNISRGKKNNGTSSRYACFGSRKEPKESGVIAEYAYKPRTPPNVISQVQNMVSGLV